MSTTQNFKRLVRNLRKRDESVRALLIRAGMRAYETGIYHGDDSTCRLCGCGIRRDGLRVFTREPTTRYRGMTYHDGCLGKSPSIRAALKRAGLLDQFDALTTEGER